MAKARKGAVPQSLQEMARQALRNKLLYVDFRNQAFVVPMLKRIVESPDMRSVWISLEKKTPHDRGPRGLRPCRMHPSTVAFMILSDCGKALDDFRALRVRKPKDHRDHYTRIASKARELAEALAGDWEFHSLAQSGRLDATPRWPMEKIMREMLERIGVPESKHVALNLEAEVNCLMPSTAAIFMEIAHAASAIAKRGTISKRPTLQRAPINYFIRRLSADLREFYREPSHVIVAAIASAAFETPVTEDQVRQQAV